MSTAKLTVTISQNLLDALKAQAELRGLRHTVLAAAAISGEFAKYIVPDQGSEVKEKEITPISNTGITNPQEVATHNN
jgi:hypothetical protein